MRSLLFLLLFAPLFIVASGSAYELTDGTALDRATGLMWQRGMADRPMSHRDAERYCRDLSLESRDDWRLPELSELRTLIVGCAGSRPGGACPVDAGSGGCGGGGCLHSKCYDKNNCACAEGKGPGENGRYQATGVWRGAESRFWSATGRDDCPGSAWRVNFLKGAVGYDERHNLNAVRCVREEGTGAKR